MRKMQSFVFLIRYVTSGILIKYISLLQTLEERYNTSMAEGEADKIEVNNK